MLEGSEDEIQSGPSLTNRTLMAFFDNAMSIQYIYVVSQTQEKCKLLQDPIIFGRCHATVDPTPYIDMCEQEACRCALNNMTDCLCDALTQYSRACSRNDVPLQWRTQRLCRKQVYNKHNSAYYLVKNAHCQPSHPSD